MAADTDSDAARRNPAPPKQPASAPRHEDTPGGGEIEWAGGLIAPAPAPGEVRVDPDDKRGV